MRVAHPKSNVFLFRKIKLQGVKKIEQRSLSCNSTRGKQQIPTHKYVTIFLDKNGRWETRTAFLDVTLIIWEWAQERSRASLYKVPQSRWVVKHETAILKGNVSIWEWLLCYYCFGVWRNGKCSNLWNCFTLRFPLKPL